MTTTATAKPALPRRLGDYLLLTKPLIVALLLFTTLSAMIVAAGHIPALSTIALSLVGGGLAAGGAGALNQYLDRELDSKMSRTKGRPLPRGRLRPREGLLIGLLLSAAGLLVLGFGVNLLSAALALLGILYYVVLYSMLLKPSTSWNIVIGGGAGAIPPLVGWAAATGSLSVEAFFLFAQVFFWTPAHFWALALLKQAEYEQAGIPMLPVVRGGRETRRQILLYSLQVLALTAIMPLIGLGGLVFLISSLLLGLVLVGYAWNLFRSPGNRSAWKMYRYSSMYLAGTFTALVLDALILG
jgi:protoheme IX farnesyltransferase